MTDTEMEDLFVPLGARIVPQEPTRLSLDIIVDEALAEHEPRPDEPEEVCTCASEVGEPHTCPFKEEIHEDRETLCVCCDYCQGQCADDI